MNINLKIKGVLSDCMYDEALPQRNWLPHDMLWNLDFVFLISKNLGLFLMAKFRFDVHLFLFSIKFSVNYLLVYFLC